MEGVLVYFLQHLIQMPIALLQVIFLWLALLFLLGTQHRLQHKLIINPIQLLFQLFNPLRHLLLPLKCLNHSIADLIKVLLGDSGPSGIFFSLQVSVEEAVLILYIFHDPHLVLH